LLHKNGKILLYHPDEKGVILTDLNSSRLIATPSGYAKDNLLYVQEIGTLTSRSPHISTRENIFSFLFMVVIKGSGTFSYKGKKILLHEGDCVFVNCHEPYAHESSAEDPWTLTWVHFYGANMAAMYDYFNEIGGDFMFHPASITDLLNIFSSLYNVVDRKDALWETLSHKYLTDIVTFAYTNKGDQAGSYSINEKLKVIREYIADHCDEKLTLDMLSEHFFISKFYLVREYKRKYGVTIAGDINAFRISKSKSMLRFSSDSIENISLACGFKECGYFIKVFKMSEGMTPLAYRKKW